MSSTKNDKITEEFGRVISKSPPIFDEVLSIPTSENDLLEKEMLTLKKDLLFTVLVNIMIEKGFQPIASDCDALDPGGSNWERSSGLYELDFQLLGFSDIRTKLLMIPLASTVVVNAIIREMDSETYSVGLSIDRYVMSINVGIAMRNLQELSVSFKNKVITPVKSKLISFCGYPGASLSEIPMDVVLKIMYCLSYPDILSLCKTCNKFIGILDDDVFWHKKFFRDYTTKDAGLNLNNWRALYKKCYMKPEVEHSPTTPPPYQFPPFNGWMF